MWRHNSRLPLHSPDHSTITTQQSEDHRFLEEEDELL